MFVRPGGVSTSLMDDAEDGVGAYEIPGIDRRTAFAGVADEFLRIDGGDAAIRECRAGRTTVHFGLVDVDAFLVLAGGSSGSRAGRAGTRCQTIAGGLCRGIKIPGIGDVVVDAGQGGASTGDDRDQARKGIRGFRGAGSDVVDAGLAGGRKSRTVRLSAVDGANAVDAVFKVHSVQAIDADQKNPLDRALAPAIILRKRRSSGTRNREGEKRNCFFHYYLREQGLLKVGQLALRRDENSVKKS